MFKKALKLLICFLFLTAYSYSSDDMNPSVFYMHHKDLHPSQLRYSRKNVKKKKAKIKKKQHAVWNEKNQTWEFAFYEGKSPLSETDYVPIIKAPFGYMIIDGHHHILASLELGAEWIPVKVIGDLSHLEASEFWEKAESMGWAYPYDLKGEKQIPKGCFLELEDDPNRYFAAISARKYNSENDPHSSGAEYPLWIKIGKSIPFIEFKIADVLYRKGLIYNSEMNLDPQFVEKARQALLDAPIEGLNIIASRVHYSEIMLPLINKN